MRILVYACPDAPAALQFVGYVLDHGDLLPVRFTGREPEALTRRIETWWAEEIAKTTARKPKTRTVRPTQPADEEEEGV